MHTLHTHKTMLAERDKKMSEPKNYMNALDAWSEEAVIAPIADAQAHGSAELIVKAKELVKRAIREKVLESYRNGQNAAPRGKERPQGARK
jgi:hypothetical protein